MTEVAFRSETVRTVLQNAAQRHNILIDGTTSMAETLGEAAALLQDAGAADKVDELRTAVKQLLEARQKISLQTEALQALGHGYTMTADATDFEAQLAERVERLEASQPRYDPERDELYRDFEEAVGGGAGPGEEQIDEDIAIEGGANQLAPNERCPITARPLLELEEPVADSRGFVYEKAAILGMLRDHAQLRCPVAGTNHMVARAELQPARRVMRAQERARRGGHTQQTQAPRGDVLDVE